jgi:hypothetical protein
VRSIALVTALAASATTARYETATVVFGGNDPGGDVYFIVDGHRAVANPGRTGASRRDTTLNRPAHCAAVAVR